MHYMGNRQYTVNNKYILQKRKHLLTNTITEYQHVNYNYINLFDFKVELAISRLTITNLNLSMFNPIILRKVLLTQRLLYDMYRFCENY